MFVVLFAAYVMLCVGFTYEQILRDPWMTSLTDGDQNDLSGNLKELATFNQQRKALAATKAYEAAVIFEELMGKSLSSILEDPKDVEKFQDAMDEGREELEEEMSKRKNHAVPLGSSRRLVNKNAKDVDLKKQAFIKKQKTSFFSFWKAVRAEETA